jgi:protein-S-isoprenylcysteine O-methyltransferase Ste14
MRMQPHYWYHIAVLLWIPFILYWIVSARKLKTVKRREAVHERLMYMIPVIVGYMMLFTDKLTYTALGDRFLNVNEAIGVAGVAITAAGVGLAIWARWHIGANWSGTVTVKEGHELITSGPYRAVRHPIYTGIILATAGAALALGEIRGPIALLLILAAFYAKARREERYMVAEFGETYREYKKHTGMLVPKFL